MGRKKKAQEEAVKRFFWDRKALLERKAHINIIISERDVGKSYQMLRMILEKYWEMRKKGQPTSNIFVRRYADDLKSAGVTTMHNCMISDFYGHNSVEEITGGEFDSIRYYRNEWTLIKVDKETGLVKKDLQPFLSATAINLAGRTKGAQFPNLDVIWLEEFVEIAGKSYLPREFALWSQMLKTFIRGRDNVKIFLTGNRIDWDCPYFENYGVKQADNLPMDTIRTYKIGRTGRLLAIENIRKPENERIETYGNNFYWAFDNPEMAAINGEWDIDYYPILQDDYEFTDVCGRFFVIYKDRMIQADIVSTDTGAFIYFHRDFDPLHPFDEDDDLVYTNEVSVKPNYRRGFTPCLSDGEEIIRSLMVAEKVFYSDNTVGDIISKFVRWANNQRLHNLR